MTFGSPLFSKIVFKFSSAEYFAVVFFGLASVVALAGKSLSGAIISLLIGMFLATIGVDPHYGTFRFGFGTDLLQSGVEFIIVMIGLFAIGEVLEMIEIKREESMLEKVKVKTNMPRFKDLWALKGSIGRGLAIGTTVGGIPGAGAAVASFVAYGVERQVGKTVRSLARGAWQDLLLLKQLLTPLPEEL